MKLKRVYRGLIRLLLLIGLLIPTVPILCLQTLSAADTDLKPGDVIGPDNWQRVQGMVGENLLRENTAKQLVGTPLRLS